MSRGGLPTLTTEATTSLSPGGTQAWSYTVSNPRPTFAAGSTAVVSLWVGTASPSASLQVQVYTAKSSGSILQTLGTMNLVVSPFTCAGYQQMVGSMTVASGTSQLPNSGQLVLSVGSGSGWASAVHRIRGSP
jgi:hypothetical protein